MKKTVEGITKIIIKDVDKNKRGKGLGIWEAHRAEGISWLFQITEKEAKEVLNRVISHYASLQLL